MVIGGINSDDVPSRARRPSPTTQTWADAPLLNVARGRPLAATLLSGESWWQASRCRREGQRYHHRDLRPDRGHVKRASPSFPTCPSTTAPPRGWPRPRDRVHYTDSEPVLVALLFIRRVATGRYPGAEYRPRVRACGACRWRRPGDRRLDGGEAVRRRRQLTARVDRLDPIPALDARRAMSTPQGRTRDRLLAGAVYLVAGGYVGDGFSDTRAHATVEGSPTSNRWTTMPPACSPATTPKPSSSETAASCSWAATRTSMSTAIRRGAGRR